MNIRETVHQIGLETAIFFGKPGWTRKEAAALGLNEKEQDRKQAEAHICAADREEIVWGSFGRKLWHLERAHELLGLTHLRLPDPDFLTGLGYRGLPEESRLILNALIYKDDF
ncbi:hypothetical protein A3C59_01005 [Candidatus Daviesbacteria bacterium RIFCSPHIGHO2_02_FULL_36_13]|uniref:Uncharacterized protein n=1 Tax=Candidatus Daviesbacteria bacterium RIFCSPHIGHO2_02_FULL_36_13 TaxID=1797768 RepID=A0A1F5JYI6_9BACT|nr:MAG: hypothetical protein A3C59_01005 [Candidatus Daviesbacteria bacterium RIFCSPHIGHO2_02_FULL_36_13]OGE43956.1 MAG: hypothetical protein A3A45_03350 [Candidatus Daviesbacteria bacterium RIFCSPLOWO2_01_FULL_36_8]